MSKNKHKMPVALCPTCNISLDGASGVDCGDASPEPGDLAICPNCQSINMFSENFQLILASNTTLKEVADHPALKKALNAAHNTTH